MINIFKSYLSSKSSYVGGKAKAAAIDGRKMYKLSSNENLLGPSPKAIEAIQKFIPTLNEYSDYSGDRFRLALAHFYKNELTEDQFVSANSGVEIIEMICHAFLEPGLNSIVCNPCFGPYNLLSLKSGARVIDVPLKREDFQLDVEGILKAINDDTRIIFLANPNNPSGSYISRSLMQTLLDQIPDHVVIVYDEVYYQFVEAKDFVLGKEFVKKGQPIIAINSFSKAYGLAGLRVGYCYSTPILANYIRNLRRPFMLNSLSQEGAMAALQDQEHIERTVQLIRSEKPKYYKAFDQLGLHYWPSEANFILVRPEMNDVEFTNKMLGEGIMVRPMAGFSAPGCVRITIGTEEANQACIKALKKIL